MQQDNKAYFTYCREHLQTLCPDIHPHLLDELEIAWRIIHYPKRAYLTHAGQIQEDAFFVVQGQVRAFYPAVEEDRTINFVSEGEFATHYTSLNAPRPSHFSFQAIEPTIVIATPYAYMRQLAQRREDVNRLLLMLLEHEYTRLMTHTECLLMRNAEDRYELFIKTFKPLLPRISVTDLSSYLGISRQNLTRIRREHLKND